MINMKKPKIGVFSLTGCGGCQLAFLDQDLEILKSLEFDPSMHSSPGKLDIAFIEGTVCSKRDISLAKDIRNKSKLVIALGSCVVSDVIFNNFKKDFKKLSEYIKIDYFIGGCPINQDELFNVVSKIILDLPLKKTESPVCMECKMNENPCLLKDLCLGPITIGGCNSICINNNIPCWGCRGILMDANIDSLVCLFKKHKINAKRLENNFKLIGVDLKW